MSKPRLFFAAMPPPQFVAAGRRMLAAHGLDVRLGDRMFAPSNWHQSFSERIFAPTTADCDALRQIGEKVSARACTLHFNRIDSTVHPSGRIYWTLRARGRPKAFDALLGAVKAPLAAAGYDAIATGVTPHVTLSYSAHDRLGETLELDVPLEWTIDELRLVIGGGEPYGYQALGRWSLQPELDPPVAQPALF